MAPPPSSAPSPDSSSSTPSNDTSSPPPNASNSSSSTPSTSSSPPPPSSSPPPPPKSSSPPPPLSSPPPPPKSSPPPSPPPPSSPPPQSPPPPPSKSPPPPAYKQSPPPSPPPPSKSNPTPPSKSSESQHFSPPPPKSPSSSTRAPRLAPPHSDNNGDDRPSPPKKSGNDSSSNSNTALVVGIAAGIGVFLLIVLISALVFCCCRKKKKTKKKKKPVMHHYYANDHFGGAHNIRIPPPPGTWPPPAPYSGECSSSQSGLQSSSGGTFLPPPPSLGFNKSTFTYEELAAATGGFSQGSLIGQGGFGYVYKGYLPSGKEVAVKQLKARSGQGEREFRAEVEIISRVHHRHLVSLVGYCIAGEQRMLVYEFVTNNTLEHHLHGKGLPTMDWPTRLKIGIGSAKGFAYLHEDCHPRIIHRDVKAANILLNYKFEAMVADFGLAKLSLDTNTHVSTRIMGTFGYLAPEYASSGKLTDKSDVFSFGVMLLELITGRRPIDHTCMEDSLVDWARPVLTEALAEGNFDELADPKLEGNYNTKEMARMVACAAASVRHSGRSRPKMSQIVRSLEGEGSLDDVLDEGGVKPGQSMFFGSGEMANSYSSNMRQLRKTALGSIEFSGVQTSESGLHPSEPSGSSGDTHSGIPRHKPHQQSQ